MYNFACVCYGDKYPVEYVQKLYNMVERNTTHLINFYVFTDHVKMQKMLNGGRLYVKKFPEHNLEGWWNKMQLFHPRTQLPGTTLYMDLDVVITGNIDCFFTYKPEADFVGINDFNPTTKQWNSSIMRFNNKWHDKLWMAFYNDRANMIRRFPGDQNLISDFIKGSHGCESFPDSWTQSYKWYDRSGTRYARRDMTYEHNGESLVTVFHGQPNPHESEQEWVKTHWS